MASFQVTAPDGRKFRVSAPEGSTQEQVLAFARQSWDRRQQEVQQRKTAGDADMRRMADPTSGMGFTDKFNAGMGKAFTDIGRGASQMVGMGPSAEETQETRQLDAPLMKSGGGMAGNVAGNIAALAPLALVPGANTVAGAGALGALAGAVQPTEGTGERLTNMGIGGGLGAGTQALAGPVAQKVGEWGGKREAAANALKSQNSVRDETLRMGQEAGYVVPGSAVNPTATNRIIESIGGKAAVGQKAVQMNTPTTDSLARKAGGLGPNEPLSRESLRAARQGEMSAPYREIAGISQDAKAALEALKQARFDSKLQWKGYHRSGQPDLYQAAKAADAKVAQLADQIEGFASKAGRPELVPALKQARQSIARNRQVQDAVNVGSGHVDPAVIGRAMDSGAPLSGELATIGRMQQAFPQFMKDSSGAQAPGTNQLLAVLAGSGGYAAGGLPGVAAAAAPFVIPPAARAAALSKTGQSVLAKPNYSVGPMAKGASALNDPETRRRAALLARSLALPSIPQAVNE